MRTTHLRGSSGLARKVMVVAGVAAVTMLGNLRLQASELRAPAGQKTATIVDSRGVGHAGPPEVAAKVGEWAPMMDVDDAGTGIDDDAHLVPAIYAWDPDVRFVYFRHVSKWM